MWSIPATHPTTVSHSGRITVVTKSHISHSHNRNTLPTTFFRQLPFRSTSTPIGESLSDLHSGGSLIERHLSTRCSALKFTHRLVRYCLATHLLQQYRLLPTSLSNHSAIAGKALIFHFFSSVTVSKLFCRLNLLSFCVL